MNDPRTCDDVCGLAALCQDRVNCPAAEAPSFVEATARFEREAVPRVCDTGRYRCAYFTWGEGPPLVFIPGLADVPRNFVAVMARLARHFRCVGYHLPAGGGDGARLNDYAHGDYVADLLAVLDHAELRQSYLFGSSFGSTVTLAALEARPERFPRAILQGGFARRRLALAERLLAGMACWWPGRMRHLPLRATVMRNGPAQPLDACPPEVWNDFLHRTGNLPIASMARRALQLHRLDLRAPGKYPPAGASNLRRPGRTCEQGV